LVFTLTTFNGYFANHSCSFGLQEYSDEVFFDVVTKLFVVEDLPFLKMESEVLRTLFQLLRKDVPIRGADWLI